MAARIFNCPNCHEPHSFATIDLAEASRPLGYICQGCQHQVDTLPEEIEQGQPLKRRKVGRF